MKTKPRSVIRPIRNGSIRAFGTVWRPEPDDPNQYVEGARYAFAPYTIYINGEWHVYPHLCYMGSEAFFKATGEEWERLYDLESPLQTAWWAEGYDIGNYNWGIWVDSLTKE